MKVLFVFFTDPPRPFSTSVAALATVVRRAGHDPLALEVSLRSEIAPVAARVDALAPDVLAVSSMTRDWPGARALLERLETRAFVVVGGYHATFAPDDVAGCARVDAIGIGEGERPLSALLDALARGEAPRTRPGLWVRRGPPGTERSDFAGEVPPADPEPDIADLPPWDYDVFGDVRASLEAGLNTFGPHVDRYLPVRASRGCPFTCTYCSAPRWGKLHGMVASQPRHLVPVAQLCAELQRLRDRYAPEGFEFWDEHFPIRLEWLREFAERYPAQVGLPFKVEMHPSAATRERLELLARAGCVLFHCGVEAGDETLRREVLDRRTPDVLLERVFEDARSLGLRTSASLMTALPHETRARASTTVQLLRKLRPDSFMWSTFHALPGTVLGEAVTARWPAPARMRFDDTETVPPKVPAAMSADEREATFRELASLQQALVRRASEDDGVSGRVQRARPVEIPGASVTPSTALCALLAAAGDESAVVPIHVRHDTARPSLMLEFEGPEHSRGVVEITPRSSAPHYRATAHLAVSYRGREAPAWLLRAIDVLVARLRAHRFEELVALVDAP